MYELKKDIIDVDIYLSLRSQVGWKVLSREQAQKALENSLITVAAFCDGVPVGMGRVVGDGAVISYIQDLIVIPSVQGQGIGSTILKELISYVKNITAEGTEMMLCLMCAKGREEFYQKHDFIPRPTESLGPGMIQYIKSQR